MRDSPQQEPAGKQFYTGSDNVAEVLEAIYGALHAYYGPQGWWPTVSGSRWEIMMGAVLTQRTSWRNVAQALNNISSAWGTEGLADPQRIVDAPHEELVALLRPVGHFNSKPRRLKLLAEFVLQHGGIEALARSKESPEQLRADLLGIWGIGPETADAILLYALQRTSFVADAYALRLASRWGLLPPGSKYAQIQALFTANLTPSQELYAEWHALIVEHGKEICRPYPLCGVCPLNRELALDSTSNRQWRCPKLHVSHPRTIVEK